jgi:hypothetical protein
MSSAPKIMGSTAHARNAGNYLTPPIGIQDIPFEFFRGCKKVPVLRIAKPDLGRGMFHATEARRAPLQ